MRLDLLNSGRQERSRRLGDAGMDGNWRIHIWIYQNRMCGLFETEASMSLLHIYIHTPGHVLPKAGSLAHDMETLVVSHARLASIMVIII